MSEFANLDMMDTSSSFDKEYSSLTQFDAVSQPATQVLDINSFSHSSDIFQMQDPLKHAYRFEFEPMSINQWNSHHVTPHYVDGYLRQDGTYVEGYYRDGDGNTSINRTAEQGGGYARSNPDGIPWNNFK